MKLCKFNMLLMALAFFLVGCSGEEGKDGAGGLSSLVDIIILPTGDTGKA